MIRGPEGSDNGDPQEGVEFNLRFETIRQLQTELAPHLSNDGLFVPADDPFPIDTVVRFRVTLPDDFVLIEGTGVVVWSRQPDETGSPPGMAIRYATLAKEAQETIDAIIDAHLASGGVLFNLERDTERSAAFPTDAGAEPVVFHIVEAAVFKVSVPI
jgi:uncharacterized protein (TIGR02266 family)